MTGPRRQTSCFQLERVIKWTGKAQAIKSKIFINSTALRTSVDQQNIVRKKTSLGMGDSKSMCPSKATVSKYKKDN